MSHTFGESAQPSQPGDTFMIMPCGCLCGGPGFVKLSHSKSGSLCSEVPLAVRSGLQVTLRGVALHEGDLYDRPDHDERATVLLREDDPPETRIQLIFDGFAQPVPLGQLIGQEGRIDALPQEAATQTAGRIAAIL